MTTATLIREVVQSLMGLGLIGASIYLAVVGELPVEFFCSLVGTALGFFLAERKNGAERNHAEVMAGRR